ncbi:hypothetical protein J7394_05185 [Ruegeria sp. R13_0]|uniref:hypothetical protein n=1 Tax=Ruegeria sp. R13_0 TaxID=2821099 RepID=UPI001AD9E671|nr:hypothetical protein [Ruegeria sp. R13_0]MBO9433586.1 hypothetical protein [Ruegeria sp. R13_0]
MPVIATITAVTFLLDGSSDLAPSFLEPNTLRPALEKAMSPADSDVRTAALKIVSDLEVAVDRFRTAVEGSADNAILGSTDKSASASSTRAIFSELDRERDRAISAVLDSRDQLVSLLDQETWSRVFDG